MEGKIFLSTFAAALLTIVFIGQGALAQTPADSVRITFRAHKPSTPSLYVPGQFNNWGNNVGGNIPPGDPSQMAYDAGLSCWLKSYTFRIHDPSDSRRTLGDSVFQYKFNQGGTSGGWYPDPLNSEQNPLDNNNSVLRLTRLFWFQYFTTEASQMITRITAGLGYANDDSVTLVRFSTGVTPAAPMNSFDVTPSFDATLRILDFVLPSPVPRGDYVRLVAYTSAGDSIVLARGGFVPPQLPLPAYAKHGVTPPSSASNDSTTFRIRVPRTDFVLLRLAPLGQSPRTADALLMRRSPGSDNWWLNVRLLPDTAYEYLYEFDGGLQIYDPWGRWNGAGGSRFSTGPAGLTADDYVWASTSYTRPPLNRAIVYELHVGEFAGGYYGLGPGQAKFTDFAHLMPYFDSLGVNAIELMPVNDYGLVGLSGHSWGYDLNSFFALEPAYGTPAEFKALIDSAHSHGIAVILDVVFNHLNDTGPLWQMQPNESVNPYFKLCSDKRPNEDDLCFFRDLDHFTPETQELVLATLRMWVEQYKIDGFRYDYTQGIGWDLGQPAFGILGWTNVIKTIYSGSVYQIAEHLPESPALIHYSGLTSGWHDSFRDRVFDEARFANVSLADIKSLILGLGAFPSNDVPSEPSVYATRTEPVNANVTHDEQSLIYEMTTFQGIPLDVALVRDRLYATLMFTSLGVPMLWQGMEFSAPRGWSTGNEKLSYRPVEWSLYPTARGQTHISWYRSLARQRKLNPALYRGRMTVQAEYAAEKTLVWTFADTAGPGRIAAVANFRATPQVIRDVPWPAAGIWYDILTQTAFTVSGASIDSLSLPAYTALVFTNIPDTVLVSVPSPAEQLPDAFVLAQNFPNPFNPVTVIGYEIAGDNHVRLGVFDILGREVAVLVDHEMPAGRYTARWNAAGMPSGVYFYRLTAGSFSYTRKMILSK